MFPQNQNEIPWATCRVVSHFETAPLPHPKGENRAGSQLEGAMGPLRVSGLTRDQPLAEVD